MDDMMGARMTRALEGYRDRIYLDTRGNPTGGYGTHLYVGRKVPRRIWDELFWSDYEQASDAIEALDLRLDPVRRAALVDMAYNLGAGKLRTWTNTLAMIRSGNYAGAAAAIERYTYYKQVGRRGQIICDMIATGDERVLAESGILREVVG